MFLWFGLSLVLLTLLRRFEVRGTGKVSWEQFLAKFQDPQSVGNGQTLPIGQNHKVSTSLRIIS